MTDKKKSRRSAFGESAAAEQPASSTHPLAPTSRRPASLRGEEAKELWSTRLPGSLKQDFKIRAMQRGVTVEDAAAEACALWINTPHEGD